MPPECKRSCVCATLDTMTFMPTFTLAGERRRVIFYTDAAVSTRWLAAVVHCNSPGTGQDSAPRKESGASFSNVTTTKLDRKNSLQQPGNFGLSMSSSQTAWRSTTLTMPGCRMACSRADFRRRMATCSSPVCGWHWQDGTLLEMVSKRSLTPTVPTFLPVTTSR